ncbi:hypothetical protein BC831DRAFT_452947 [Entophlyctis helioformis]|nr:hypothetical protein BC831DRAFT_452947 [Entophlyctis helioformis]
MRSHVHLREQRLLSESRARTRSEHQTGMQSRGRTRVSALGCLAAVSLPLLALEMFAKTASRKMTQNGMPRHSIPCLAALRWPSRVRSRYLLTRRHCCLGIALLKSDPAPVPAPTSTPTPTPMFFRRNYIISQGVPAASNGQKRFVSLAISRDQAAYGDAARYSKNCMPVLSIAQHKAARAAHAAYEQKSEPGRQLRQLLLLKAAGAHDAIHLPVSRWHRSWLWWIGGWSRWPLHDATTGIGWLCVYLCKAFPS